MTSVENVVDSCMFYTLAHSLSASDKLWRVQ